MIYVRLENCIECTDSKSLWPGQDSECILCASWMYGDQHQHCCASAYLKSKQILLFGFAEKSRRWPVLICQIFVLEAGSNSSRYERHGWWVACLSVISHARWRCMTGVWFWGIWRQDWFWYGGLVCIWDGPPVAYCQSKGQRWTGAYPCFPFMVCHSLVNPTWLAVLSSPNWIRAPYQSLLLNTTIYLNMFISR